MEIDPSQEPQRFKHSDSQFDSQFSTILEQNFLAPLGDSQETQEVVSEWHNDIGDHEGNVTKQPLQLTQGVFFSRPVPEDPLDFQGGFQYSKAPTPQIRSSRPNATQNTLGFQIDPTNDISVKTDRPLHGPDRTTVDDPLDDSRDTRGLGTQASTLAPTTSIEKYEVVSICSDHSSDGTLASQKRSETGSLKDLPPGAPFQNTSTFNKVSVSRQPPIHARSPRNRLEGHRLPKVFADIQRKALIQSNHSSVGHSAPHSKSQGGKASSYRLNTPEAHQDIDNGHEASHTPKWRSQERPTRDSAFKRSAYTPRTQGIDGKPRRKQSIAVEIARPLTHDTHKEYIMARPASQTSNISKVRAPPRTAHRRMKEIQAIPGMEESETLRCKLGESWNNFFTHEWRRNRYWGEKMKITTEKLVERENQVSECLEEIQRQGQIIENLEHAEEEQHVICQEKEAALKESTERVIKLRGRMKEYRDRLNDVTKEQQSIFNYLRPRFQQLREQMKQEEVNHKNSLDQAFSATKEARDKIKESVKEVQTLSQCEIQKLRLEVRTLEVKLTESAKEVNREKDHTKDLRRELEESHELNKDAFKSLDKQNHELMKKSDERAIQIQNVKQCVSQQEQNIQSFHKFLEDGKANAPSLSGLVESFKALQTEAINRVISELRDHAAPDREQSCQAIEGLKTDVLAIREVCTGLSEQIQNNQHASEWKEKYVKAQMDHQALLGQTERLKEKFAKMQTQAKMQLEQHEGLQQELNSLRAGAKAMDESNRLLETLQKERETIQGSLEQKEECIRGLEDELRRAHEALSAQDCRLKDNERQFHDEQERLTKAVASCREQHDQAIKQVRAEECARTRAEYRGIENRLQEVDQDCDRLQNELVQVKRNAENALTNCKGEAAREAQEVLEPILGLMDSISAEFQAAKHAESDLNAKLESWSNGHVELSLLRQAVQKIEKGQQKSIENANRLGELLEVQKKMEAKWKWHQSEVDALNRAIELEKSVKTDMERFSSHVHKGKEVPHLLRAVNRRVTIKSPGIDNDQNKMVPVSHEDERTTRRQTAFLKGIMKPANFQVERRPEERYHKAFPYSAYNRPVSGSSTRIQEEPVDEDIAEETETVSTEMSMPRKRKSFETETKQRGHADDERPQLAEEHRARKISRSMTAGGFRDPISEEPAVNTIQRQAQLFYLRGGPIERRPRSLITYGPTDRGSHP
ncbi:hypothetical protein F5X98DRAFT_384689 [Xylaria grammica]|nr:hypothetical protein F5X98DRAFT_384689 [Xylaria grammica]